VKTTGSAARPRGDRALWREAMRDVQPLRGRPAALSAQPIPPPEPPRAAPCDPGPRAAPPSPNRFAGLDRANAERLKRGLHKIEAVLDLHGMTQVEAHRELAAFVAASRIAGRRCVLVITGRGLGPNGPGVLKASLPRWLEEPLLRQQVLAVAPAQPRHGGGGASYLLLRRLR
jgi:DNA-nicking Smr family endonuclease